MNCADARFRWLEHLHGTKLVGTTSSTHFLGCVECAAWASRQGELDRVLTAELAPPALSVGWLDRLERRRRMEQEYQDALGHLHVRLTSSKWLLFLGCGALIALAAVAMHDVLVSPLQAAPASEAAVFTVLAACVAAVSWYGARAAQRLA